MKKIQTYEWPSQPKSFITQGLLAVTGGVLIQMFTGCFSLWGNIALYVLSYFHIADDSLSYDFIFLLDTTLNLANWLGYMAGVVLF
jgi:hypothetical protein